MLSRWEGILIVVIRNFHFVIIFKILQVFNKSLGAYQRPLSTHGVRNQQDSTFSLAGGYNAMENRGKRSAVKVNAPPGGGGSNFW